MIRLLWFVLLVVIPVDSCWLSSKKKAVDKIEAYVARANFDAHVGVTQAELQSGIAALSPTTAWMLRTFTDTNDLFKRCDTNADGRLTIDEIRGAPLCVSSCIKQLAIIRFL